MQAGTIEERIGLEIMRLSVTDTDQNYGKSRDFRIQNTAFS
jgi:hypothetical protein